jgi:murein L,D-transpeptidase YcbB/YkuD
MRFRKFSWIKRAAILAISFFLGFYWLQSYLSSGLDEDVQARIQEKTASVSHLEKLRISGETIQSPEQLQKMYNSNSFTGFWSAGPTISDQSTALQQAVEKAFTDGLDPAFYHSTVLKQWIQSLNKGIGKENADSLAQFDILMTDAFVSFASHQYAGAVYGNGMNVSHDIHMKKVSLRDSLLIGVNSKKMNAVLTGFVNNTPPYQKLKKNLQYYRRIAQKDGFEFIPLFNPDSSNQADVITKLCARLTLTGELPEKYIADTCTPFIQTAVKKFQYSHGLDTSGLLTRETLDELNIPITERIRQIELNMERWRWLPREPVKEFVFVNIPGFFMEVQEDYQTKLHMRAIVGKEFTQTPLFYADMKHIVINPYWDVPLSIASKEILPILKKDPGYISRSHMQMFTTSGVEINPYDINWSAYSESYFPYKIRQVPGPWNSLGQIKFLFPNPYSVYLHGTPHPELFSENIRMFSHGCMRIEDPVLFATYLFRNQPGWDREKIETIIKSQEETWVKLPYKLQVYVAYNTCWVDDNNILHFQKDVYGHDNMLAQELFQAGSISSDVISQNTRVKNSALFYR